MAISARRSRAPCRAFAGCQLLAFAMAATTSSSISLSFSTDKVPSDAATFVERSFAGFGIEPSNLFSFTGETDTNELTVNLLQNLGDYTGKPPHIRIGGNTQDYMVYDDSQDQYTVSQNSDASGMGAIKFNSMLIGPNFFEAANRLPTGTPVTWGLNLAYDESDYISRIVTMAQQVLNRCKNLDIVAFELGNEPDIYYSSSDFRPSNWSGAIYTSEWLTRTAAIYGQVLEPAGLSSYFFEPGATSHTTGTTFEIETLVTDGITKEVNGSSYVATWNQHDYTYFVGVATAPLTMDYIMDFTNVEAQFADWIPQVAQAEHTDYPYALREMGMVGPLGMTNITDAFGGALYTLNFLLYAASLNISSVQFHMTDNSYTAAIAPIQFAGLAPHARPLYYGHAAFTQIIGPTCNAQVVQYQLASFPSGYDGYVRAYSIYQGGSLTSLTVVNAKTANASETDKANLTVSVTLPTSLAGKTVHLAYLTNDGIDSQFNTTWNGISYEANGDGTPSTVSDADETTTIGSDGSLTLSVRDSQAIVAQIGSNVGSLSADETACSAMASRSPGTHMSTSGAASATSKPSNDATASSSSKSNGTSGEANASNSAGKMKTDHAGVFVTCLVPLLSLTMGFLLS